MKAHLTHRVVARLVTQAGPATSKVKDLYGPLRKRAASFQQNPTSSLNELTRVQHP